ncbi:hypothetical protein BV898_19249 [Hypsibius exemplaris]|uniref:ubiquitinyl hydrolase 1 n=1 Tax=Hypsibius exemplaris TaxID=2072580 RepID=A0A9X6NLB6_HYPEX|nr:hypothetical protein BV898_19249 [Hypsibius exemplaris]
MVQYLSPTVSDVCLKFDDEKVTPVYTEEVLKLSGGGDWHCAYVLLYGPRPVPVRVEKAPSHPPSFPSAPLNPSRPITEAETAVAAKTCRRLIQTTYHLPNYFSLHHPN